MTPFWKIRRELLRIWRQLVFVLLHPVEQAWFRLHRHLCPGAYRTQDGAQLPTGHVAIFVIYQPGALQDTVLTTCQHLGVAGYTVHLVSNAPLTDAEVARLHPLCGLITQRPNHGYDFGGYQQAILTCLDDNPPPTRLLLVNDSIWFPALMNCDLLDRLHATGADVAGAVYYDHRTPRRAHLQSYLIAFSERALASDAFRSFWRDYAMSNNKVRTVRNGEMRLTHACREAGLTVAALHSAYEAPDLSPLSACTRAELAAYDRARMGGYALSRAGGGCGYVLSNHPVVNFGLWGFSILKKDRSAPYRAQRAALRAPEWASLRARMEPSVLAAVERWDAP